MDLFTAILLIFYLVLGIIDRIISIYKSIKEYTNKPSSYEAYKKKLEE